MRVSLLQCFSVDTSRGPRMETAADPIWADRKYLSAPRIPSFSRENHFPFFASGPRNAPRKGGRAPSTRAPPLSFPFLALVISGTCARALPGAPTCLLWRIQSQWRRGWRFRYEFPAFRCAAAAVADIEYTQFEKWGISAAKFLRHVRPPYLPDHPARRHKWGLRYFTWLSIWRIHDWSPGSAFCNLLPFFIVTTSRLSVKRRYQIRNSSYIEISRGMNF